VDGAVDLQQRSLSRGLYRHGAQHRRGRRDPDPSGAPNADPHDHTDLDVGPRLIVLGWDSATFDVVDPLLDEGRLPTLKALIERGSRAPLRSTWPPMTDCAWTSIFTGRNPGGHGIFGSWYRAPGAYACRYFSSRDRRAPALWELTRGVRHLVWNVPMAFPPQDIEGVMVAGYGSPPGSTFTAPSTFQDRLAEKWPLEDLLDRAPHSSLEGFLEDLLRGLEAQGEALVWAIRESAADVVEAVWPHIDRAQHFFWRHRGSAGPLGDAIESVYQAMDETTGRVVEAFSEADVIVVSDHGAGPLHGDVNLGAWLARRGDATYGSSRRSALAGLGYALPPRVRKAAKRLAPGLARRAVGASLTGQLGSFDWTTTRAFMGFHGDLWLNLAGRERNGIVAPEDAGELLDELRHDLLSLRDPRRDVPVFEAVHRREEIYSGGAADQAPDLIVDSWSKGYRVAPSRGPSEELVTAPFTLSGVTEAWSSDHRPIGIFVAAGPRIEQGSLGELHLYDITPTVLALVGAEVPADLDGRVVTEAVTPDWLARNPVRTGDSSAQRSVDADYSDEEAAAVAEHLKDLGYIE
jgi:predicted AlkP superfamily phosphohydrolase/phosphomutase